MARENTDNVVWFLAGAAIGATLGILFAPKSGEETRELIARRASESGRDLADRGRELYDKGREFASEAAELFERGKSLGRG
jgi:gas vesicle protein